MALSLKIYGLDVNQPLMLQLKIIFENCAYETLKILKFPEVIVLPLQKNS